MATVYLARDVRHDRLGGDQGLRGDVPVDVQRFHREIRVLANLRHPFILPLHDSGEAAGELYFVMPYIDGESLRARLVREGRLPVEQALEIARQIADALQTAHDQGVIHRDVKPENILLTRSGHALLADFGIARAAAGAGAADTMTQAGLTIGTVAYMSPEQALGERDLDARSDLYALGCVLYEMLAGTPPFTGPTRDECSLKASECAAARSLALRFPRFRRQLRWRWRGRSPRSRATARRRRGSSRRRWRRAAEREGMHRPPSPLTVAVAASRLSVAVLPIATIGGTPDDEYFGEGLTEELTLALSRLEGLRVVSRTSAASFRGQSLSLSAIAAQLGVEFVIEGSVRRAGDRLRFSAKLIRASEDSPLWSETFDRTVHDVFAVQDEITSRVVDTIADALQLGKLRGQVPVAATSSLRGVRPVPARPASLVGAQRDGHASRPRALSAGAGARSRVRPRLVGPRRRVGGVGVMAIRRSRRDVSRRDGRRPSRAGARRVARRGARVARLRKDELGVGLGRRAARASARDRS